MIGFLSYIIKVNFSLIILFFFYYIFLRKFTFHKSNRFYLLAALLISFVLPLFNVDIGPISPTNFIVDDFSEGYHNTFLLSNQYTNSDHAINFSIVNILSLVYSIVVIILFSRIFQSLLKIRNLAKRSLILNYDGNKYVITD